MDVVSVGPLPVGSLVWQPRPSTWVLTVVCKATFVLQPGEAKLAPEQEALHDEDDHWNDDPNRSVRAPGDLSPVKPMADVLLVGHAFAPGKAPTRALVVRLAVGEVSKAIEITCDHGFLPDGSLYEGPPFTRMSLKYERAAGGPGTWNPVGVAAGARDAEGRPRAPNLKTRAALGATASSIPALAAFGPLAPRWPSRMERLGRNATTFASENWRARPLPEGMDLRYFNQAPLDQQQPSLRENERIVLENLHPEHAHLTTTLPGLRPAAFVERGRAAVQRLAMRADTLWIDTDRGLATLTWRGQLLLEHADEAGRVLIAVEQPGREITAADLVSVGASHRSSSEIDAGTPPSSLPPLESQNPLRATLTPNRAPVRRSRTLPFAAPLPSIDRPTERLPPRTHSTPEAVLPFHSAPPSPSQPPMPVSSTHGGSAPDAALPFHSPPPPSSQPAIPLTSTYGGAAMLQPPMVPPAPSPQAPPPPATQPSMPLTSTYGGGAMLQPPVVPPAPSPQAPPPPAMIPALAATRPEADSPWAGRSSATPVGAPLRESIGMAAVALAAAAPPPAPAAAESAYAEGAIGASNAAAGVGPVPSPWTPPRRTPAPIPEEEPAPSIPSEPLQLFWFHPAIVVRIRNVPRWKSMLDEMQQKELDRDLDDVDAGKETWEIEDRQAVFEILARGEREGRRGVEEALRASVRKDGKMSPPLVLVDGEMELPFDELEALKAAVSTATAVTGPGDEALRAAVGMGKEFLQTPGLSASAPVCEGLVTRIREAFSRERKGLPADYLDVQVERALVTGRHYQKREVFGGACLRVLLSTPGEKAAMVGYVPADLAKKLPMGRRLRARLLAEVHPAQDPYEELRGVALRGVALARVGGIEKAS